MNVRERYAMRSTDVTSALKGAEQEAKAEHGAVVSAFIKKFGSFEIFSKTGLDLIDGLSQRLGRLQEDKTIKGSEQSLRALAALTTLLRDVCQVSKKSYPNNNYNFYINSQNGKEFLEILYPKGAIIPTIKDDLCAEMCRELAGAMDRFSAKECMNLLFRGGYNLYAYSQGDPIQATKMNLKEAIEQYDAVRKIVNLVIAADKDISLVIVVAKIETKLNQFISLLEKTSPGTVNKSLIEKFKEIVGDLERENLLSPHTEKSSEIRALGKGVLLPKLVACMEKMQEKFNISMVEIKAPEINFPKPADSSHFKGQVVEYCHQLMGDIERALVNNSVKNNPLNYLKTDIAKYLADLSSDKPLADICMQIFAEVVNCAREMSTRKTDESSVALMESALPRIKEVIGSYSIGMTVAAMAEPARAETLGEKDEEPAAFRVSK